jgi:magnesium transporter
VAAHLANAGEGFVWLGLKDPNGGDLMALASEFDLHPLAVEDAAHGHTRSKLEMFGNDLFMVISTVAYVEHEELTDTSEVVATGQVMVFLGDHFVITVRRGEHAQLSALRRTMEVDPARLARGPSEVLYAIADKIIDDYLDVVAEFEKDVDEIESRVFARGGRREVERVYQLKRELIEFKRCVMPLGAPLLRLATRELPVIPPEAKAYFRELADHHTEAREAVASFDEVLLLDLAGRPGPSVGGRQRGHAQDLSVGGDRCSADDGGRHLRDELLTTCPSCIGVTATSPRSG